MATNTGKNSRVGSVTGRTQFKAPNGNYAKRDAANGQIMDQKTSGGSYKGVAHEKDGRRS